MIESIITFSIRHRALVIGLALLVAALGAVAAWETPVDAIEGEPQSFRVRSGVRRFEAAAVVHAAGRLPDLDDLDLAAAGSGPVRAGSPAGDLLEGSGCRPGGHGDDPDNGG